MHIVLEKARKYSKKAISNEFMSNYTYEKEMGFWINRNNGLPLMLENFPHKPRTKKDDIETGEDRKGE